jgi:putative mRNA 3-end processing factor
MATPLLQPTDRGLWCADGGFFIDPWRPVDRAVITHGHSDHARPGHGAYLTTDAALPVIRRRLGDLRADTLPYGRTVTMGGVTVSFHPAGHVPGSAQVRVERGGEVWVVTGDYKTTPDRLSEPWEPVRCHTLVTECTFGLPVFTWEDEAAIAAQINGWWAQAADEGRVAMLGVYALGKAQRVMTLLDPAIGPILTHGAVEEMTQVLRAQGYALPATTRVTPDLPRAAQSRAIVLAPPSALGSAWARRFGTVTDGYASGWMRLRGVRRRRAADRGFVLSDHADWPGLNAAVRATGAMRVLATHGYTAAFSRWLADQGLETGVVATAWEGEALDRAPDPSDAVTE